MLVANLWAKQLIVGDHIVKVDLREHYKFGLLKRFTVERTELAHAAEEARIAQKKEEESQSFLAGKMNG